ncbi:NOG1 family protein [Caldivirga sp. UBA161]|uniref:NOG1 family protein n=1 Tax=Caldivirga sp. UBA161 TaxID=1915569 RepID=UPI0025C4FBB3|nr:GTPase [Caldivirga sp. UBA161]
MNFKSTLPYIPNAEEVVRQLISKYKSIEAKSPTSLPGVERLRRLEVARVKGTSGWLLNLFRNIAFNMPFMNDLHPFYRELISIIINIDDYKHSLGKLINSSKAVGSISRDAVRMIKNAQDKDEIVKARKMYLSRVIDLINDLEPELRALKEAAIKISRLPSVSVEKPTIVISGMPNTGKSSLVACVSTKKPEIADYPFTTKQIIIGHVKVYGMYAVQVIDTPGLLDRPLSERNKIELQAILALRHLADSIVFMIDPTQHSGYTLNQQLSLLKEVGQSFKANIIVAINKVDLATEEEVRAVEDSLRSLGYSYRLTSALKCTGTRELIDELINGPLRDKLITYLRVTHERALGAELR